MSPLAYESTRGKAESSTVRTASAVPLTKENLRLAPGSVERSNATQCEVLRFE